jgi:Cleft lip and palate transmembrane protein 1 (CLPTM1)
VVIQNDDDISVKSAVTHPALSISSLLEGTMLLWLLIVSYLLVSFYTIWQTSLPSKPCLAGSTYCHYPLVLPGDPVALQLLVFEHNQWHSIESCCLNTTLPFTGSLPTLVTNNAERLCNITLPDSSRIRWKHQERPQGGPLLSKFRMRSISKDGRFYGPVLVDAHLEITRIVERRSESIPHLKYGSQPIVLRFVAEDRSYGGPPPLTRNDGIQLHIAPWNHSAYLPLLYVDENGLQHGSQREVSSNGTNKPPISLKIQLSSLTPIRDTITHQISFAISMAEYFLPGNELDEIRYFLKDERLYRFFLTQIISFLHIWLEYLAFRDEIRFYRGKTNFVGVSLSTVTTRMVCSFIIFLYLADGAGTSWVILVSVFGGVLVDAWKVGKLIQPKFVMTYPFVVFSRIQTANEQKTAHYDSIAMTYLALMLYPVVIGWAVYALVHENYTSYYSWLVSNLANAVYTFGFIGLCPQLYVNYRLKSVAHLPWKVFVYKIFSTFVDDVFAFLIDMPWKHRIMTLRDDVVFVMFLIQAYIYRVDKSRPNEYGYAYNEITELKVEEMNTTTNFTDEKHAKTE